MSDAWDQHLQASERARQQSGMARSLRHFEPLARSRARVDGREVIALASNDYLGLALEPELLAPWLEQQAYGAGASRLITGTQSPHIALEAKLAELRGTEAALYLPTGYQANLAAVSALADSDTEVFSDALNHASLIDGCRLSRAKVSVYPHKDIDALAELLDASAATRKLIVSDSLFSMDGDFADLPALAGLAADFDALLLIDDAHGFGALGKAGDGVPELQGISASEIGVVTGTFSKALGGLGGFICASTALIHHLINTARPLIFSTAASPIQCAASLAALEWMVGEEATRRRDKLMCFADRLRAGISDLGYRTGGESQIVPLWLDSPDRAVPLSQALLERGILAPAIRPPTVPAGTSMLRFSVNAALDDADVDVVLAALA